MRVGRCCRPVVEWPPPWLGQIESVTGVREVELPLYLVERLDRGQRDGCRHQKQVLPAAINQPCSWVASTAS